MREILIINPKKKRVKRRAAKKTANRSKKKTGAKPRKRTIKKASLSARKKSTGVKTMAKRKNKKKSIRRNSSRRRITRAAKRVSKKSVSLVKGMNVQSAFKNVIPTQIGMFAAKLGAKKFSEEFTASETDPESWNYASYIKGGVAAFAAGMVAQNFKAGYGQKVLEGGINLMLFKLIENEFVAPSDSEWIQENLGAGDGDSMIDDERGVYVLGEGGNYIPVDERHRLPEMAGNLEPVGPLGGSLEPVGPLGAVDPFERAFFR